MNEASDALCLAFTHPSYIHWCARSGSTATPLFFFLYISLSPLFSQDGGRPPPIGQGCWARHALHSGWFRAGRPQRQVLQPHPRRVSLLTSHQSLWQLGQTVRRLFGTAPPWHGGRVPGSQPTWNQMRNLKKKRKQRNLVGLTLNPGRIKCITIIQIKSR